MAWTLDAWDFAPESAGRTNHPAPFPIELPRRLIELYTYKNDLVLDPFMGSGQTAIACMESRRRYTGYEIVPEYVDNANNRIRARSDFQGESTNQASSFAQKCDAFLHSVGYEGPAGRQRISNILEITRIMTTPHKKKVWFDYHGSFRGNRPGLVRTDTVKKVIANASFAYMMPSDQRPDYYCVLTSNLPKKGRAKDMLTHAKETGYIDKVLSIYDEKDREILKGL